MYLAIEDEQVPIERDQSHLSPDNTESTYQDTNRTSVRHATGNILLPHHTTARALVVYYMGVVTVDFLRVLELK